MFDEEPYSICEDCTKCCECPERTNNKIDCEDFNEIVYVLSELGIFSSVINDLGWDTVFGNKSKMAWEVYMGRTKGDCVLNKDVFEQVLEDFEFAKSGSTEANVAFELMESRMRKHGYISEDTKK